MRSPTGEEAGTGKVATYVELARGGDTSLTGYKLAPGSYLHKERLVQRCALTWFRTGSHWLRVEVGRWAGLPRAQRTCQLCGGGAVEDEAHALFHCAGYTAIRVAVPYAALFAGGAHATVAAFLAQDAGLVAAFVEKCRALREDRLGGLATT